MSGMDKEHGKRSASDRDTFNRARHDALWPARLVGETRQRAELRVQVSCQHLYGQVKITNVVDIKIWVWAASHAHNNMLRGSDIHTVHTLRRNDLSQSNNVQH